MNEPRKNILLMCIYPPLLDGSAYTNFEFARGLSENGYNVTVITHPSQDQDYVDYDRWSEQTFGIQVIRVPIDYVYESAPPSPERLSLVSHFIRNGLTDKNNDMPDIGIIGHDSWAWYESVLHEFGLPVVQWIMGTPTRAIQDGIYPDEVTSEYIKHICNADYVITIADHFKDLVISWDVPASYVTTIGNGIDVSMFYPKLPNKELQRNLGIEKNMHVIMHTSNLFPVKRVTDIVEAANIVMNERTDVIYVIIGEGPDSEKLHAKVGSSPFKKRFRLLGQVAHSKIPDYMNLAKAFVLASESEGYPRVAMEAMACGVHLIASDMPAGRECTLDGSIGTNYQMGNPVDLAEKTFEVLEMELDKLQIIRTKALAHVQNNFTYDRQLSRYIDCIEGILSTRKEKITQLI